MKRKVLMESFIEGMPKAELHLHIEGTLEPELMLEIAKRNDVKVKRGVRARALSGFKNLQDFLNAYYEGVSVLLYEQDFYDLTWAYLIKAHSQSVLHTEIFFDPQAHMRRGVKFESVINGIYGALRDAERKLRMSTGLIMCFMRDLSVESAFKTLEEALPYKNWIVAVGLNSAEVGNPPSKFREVFRRAIDEGLLTVAHAGEEGPAQYVWEAINLLKVSRIDHGNRSLEDESLVEELVRRRVPLTLCPLSNLKLGVIEDMRKHPLKRMMEMGLMVTVNSDDPAYFGGYINENYLAVQRAQNLSAEQIYQLAKNSFNASFLSEPEKQKMITKLMEYMGKVEKGCQG